MRAVSALGALLRAAFPNDEAGHPVCAWCGRPRGSDKALCRAHWFGLTKGERAAYWDMDIETRAQWIVDRIIVTPPAPPAPRLF